ncbi:hypothetical protein HNQ56_002924 [Anaerotaenia torta]|uniref:cyclophilin-like fold protein n=1 Tax=Anaerotaenia torta TaxID=433293 RepID=UPI003D1D2CBB
MKKRIATLLLVFLLIAMAGCGKASGPTIPSEDVPSAGPSSVPSVPDTAPDNTAVPSLPPSEEASSPGEDTVEASVIQISDGKHVISFQLNDSTAAKELYDQLPLSLAVEDYSNNEKIFYPPKALDISDTPKAGGEIGTLAYYAPWADVVMFFGSYSPNGSLYELGQAVSGSDQISLLEGTITIEAVP